MRTHKASTLNYRYINRNRYTYRRQNYIVRARAGPVFPGWVNRGGAYTYDDAIRRRYLRQRNMRGTRIFRFLRKYNRQFKPRR